MNKTDSDLLIANIDIDGTVADFDGAMQAKMRQLMAPGEESWTGIWKDCPPHIKARRELIKAQPGFWQNLPFLKAGFEIVGELRALRYKLNILSKGPGDHPLAWAEKVRWCQEHIPDATITLSEDKSLVYGRILVDDWPSFFLPWLAVRPRGLVVCVAQSWNEDFAEGGPKAQPNIFRYDGTNLAALRVKLLRNSLRLTDSDPLPI